MYKLYCLISPIDNKIRYIGYTKHKLEKRLKEHIKSSTRGDKNSHRGKWIRSLTKLNLNPIIKELTSCSQEKVKELEIELIKHYKQFCKLTNGTIGGDGVFGLKWSEEARLKCSQRQKGTIRLDSRYKVEALNTKTGEFKVFNDKKEASEYIGCKEQSIAYVSCGLRKQVYGWEVKMIKKGAQ